MLRLIEALKETTSHGLSRTVTDKPMYVRLAWLVLYLVMLGLFFNGFLEFVAKLKANQVTTSLDANQLSFQFPDIYACMESSFSASYSTNVDKVSRNLIQQKLAAAYHETYKLVSLKNISGPFNNSYTTSQYSGFFPQSLPYNLLIDVLAHRTEQAIIESNVVYKSDVGFPVFVSIEPTPFYHANYLRCFKFVISGPLQKQILRSVSSSGIVLTLLIDSTVPDTRLWNSTIESNVYFMPKLIPISDWGMSVMDILSSDRRAGARVFFAPPGEYPSEFVQSVLLSPGKHYSVEISMTQQVYTAGQFECQSKTPQVQFLNPYDETPYNYSYSKTYCYYYEYHKKYQSILNSSGQLSPLPWPLKGIPYWTNVSRMAAIINPLARQLNGVEQDAHKTCLPLSPCSTLSYKVSISSSDWPSRSSLSTFIEVTLNSVRDAATRRNQNVPALDFLLTGNASSVASYVRENLLKVHLKPARVLCDRVTFSRDYGASNFISDVGGIMGIYLGMSLLTLCEIFELVHDLFVFCHNKKDKKSIVTPDTNNSHSTDFQTETVP